MKYEIFEGEDELWYWRLRAGNNKIIADGGQGYQKIESCFHGLNLVKNSRKAPVYAEYEIEEGKWRWVLIA